MALFDSFTSTKNLDKTKSNEHDIGMVQEIFEMVKNLTSLESHSFTSYISTGDSKWLEMNKDLRKTRTHYLGLITKGGSGNIWCMSKHLCEVAMRLQETYTRYLSIGDHESAKKCANDAADIYLKFLKINGYTEGKLVGASSA